MTVNTYRQKKTKKKSGKPFLSIFSLEKLFEEGVPVQYLPKVLYVAFFLVLYIGNTHYAARTVRETDKLKVEVDDLRADYTTLKADLMFASKQSEVAKKTMPYGIGETLRPPYIIKVEKGEY
ncbi:FtsL-like putative cell division protein [Cytophagaceae bacterium ABcell3]|nr:FtsL-like putative cell division protein [Cytophagaceae bacterium ABcell3]